MITEMQIKHHLLSNKFKLERCWFNTLLFAVIKTLWRANRFEKVRHPCLKIYFSFILFYNSQKKRNQKIVTWACENNGAQRYVSNWTRFHFLYFLCISKTTTRRGKLQSSERALLFVLFVSEFAYFIELYQKSNNYFTVSLINHQSVLLWVQFEYSYRRSTQSALRVRWVVTKSMDSSFISLL